MRHTYDDQADALYVHLSDEPIKESVVIDEDRVVDVDSSGNAVGIEILGASEGFEHEDLIERFGLQDHRRSFEQLKENPPGRVAYA